ncbi:MAG: FecR family protein [Bacteroidota bacterium]
MFEEKDDTIMARWLAGELTEAERADFEASSEAGEYQRLVKGIANFEKPYFEKEVLRERIWKGIENQKTTKVVQIRPLYYAIGIAASIVLVFGLFFNQVKYSTGVGEKMVVDLPDGSLVHLNAASQLTHRRFFWKDNKTVHLKGEGYFAVTKGDGFKVNTSIGNVSVLGTQFNVKARKTQFELYCYEGRVRYENTFEQQDVYLNAGDAIRLKNNILLEFQHTDQGPLWQNGRSQFSNADLRIVMNELQYQYGISFTYEPQLIQGHFTGTFVHNDLDLALKSVFIPMGIAYELSEDQKTIILKAR